MRHIKTLFFLGNAHVRHDAINLQGWYNCFLGYHPTVASIMIDAKDKELLEHSQNHRKITKMSCLKW